MQKEKIGDIKAFLSAKDANILEGATTHLKP